MNVKPPYGLNALSEFVETVILSICVQNSKPLSALIIGMPDSGKTEVLMQYNATPEIMIESDMTGFGLVNKILPLIAQGEIKYLIIPDLSKVLEGRGSAGNQLIATLNDMCEEGFTGSATFHSSFFHTNEPVKCPFITSLTEETFKTYKKPWKGIGFLSRVIPFHLGYNEEDIERALDTIEEGRQVFSPKKLDLKRREKIESSNEMNSQIRRIMKLVARRNNDMTAFRSFKNMLSFAKAHALLRGEREVNEEDITFIRALVPFWYNPQVGSDCDYYIIRALPATTEELLRDIDYSKSFIYKRLKEMKKLEIIKEEAEGGWAVNM